MEGGDDRAMKADFIVKENGNRRLIAIFAGWSTDADFYRGDYPRGWDVLVLHSFRSFEPLDSLLDGYDTIYVFAWSLGVFAAEKVMGSAKPSLAIAVNGSRHPVDDKLGIPKAIFEGTRKGLSERNLLKFRMRMFSSRQDFEEMAERFPTLPIEDLQTQLAAFEASVAEPSIRWDRSYISTQDRIFPIENLRQEWSNGTETVELEASHFIDLPKLIRRTIPDCEKVGERFLTAAKSYDVNATAQAQIADALVELIRERGGSKLRDVLEIGVGSGLFTTRYMPLLQPDNATYVDLFEPSALNLAANEKCVAADGERYILSLADQSFDAILSASTIQWFIDPCRWLSIAYGKLRPGGFIACSTFLPGNLHELDSLRPSPIVYRRREQIERTLQARFGNIKIAEKTIRLEFSDVRQLLLHLKRTGVGGHAVAHTSLSEIARRLPRETAGGNTVYPLTYKALMFVAERPVNE